MRRLVAQAIMLVVVLVGSAIAAPPWPALTGRVVDNAQIISAETQQKLTQQLAAYERGTTNQVVVFTTPSLAGQPLEDYSNQLLRHWQLGQKGKDNGVLLVIAVQDHALRIEVGYGLEGVLTDVLAQQIIHTIIVPNFKAGKMEQGVVAGTEAILAVLGGKGVPAAPRKSQHGFVFVSLGFVFFIIWLPLFINRRRRRASLRAGQSSVGEVLEDIAETAVETAIDIALFTKGGSGNSGGDNSGGGFSGGGGSSGGGGASGSW